MKRSSRWISIFACFGGLIGAFLIAPVPSKPVTLDEAIKAEVIIAKHIEAIGPPDLLKSINSHVIRGTCKYTFRSGISGQAAGDVAMASDGAKSLIAMAFAGTDYPAEQLAFDGKQVTTSYIRPGARTPLGSFILMDQAIVKEGLMGGVLGSSWPLLDLTARNPKLEFGGTRKVENRQFYVLRYKPRGGSDFSINLYFDKETFLHVRSEYDRLVSAQIGRGVDASAGVRSTRYHMNEEFSDFKSESGLTMPHTYKLQIRAETPNGAQQSEWSLTLNEFKFNLPIDASLFKLN